MAMTGLLALIDDIATILDDVAILTKVAAKKTAGVLGDDLALNAAQVTGVKAEREIPVVWAVAKGSFVNKLILVPLALAISAFIPALVTPLLMIGGAYLCFEGFEKCVHKFLHSKEEEDLEHKKILLALADPNINLAEVEKKKIKGAIRTDFILSAEIVVISLGTVSDSNFLTQVLVISSIALFMTIGVYSLVAGIVKIDDLGYYLLEKSESTFKQRVGKLLLLIAPKLMKSLSVLGTIAMFLVGGGIIAHGMPFIHHLLHELKHLLHDAGTIVQVSAETLANGLVGVVAGAIILLFVHIVQKVKSNNSNDADSNDNQATENPRVEN